VRHDAIRIIDSDLSEFFFGFFVPEGVKKSHAALERLSDGGRAGNREDDRPELGGGEVFVVMVGLVIVRKSGASKSSAGKDGKGYNKRANKRQ
jgi:hypothetical protein